MTDPNNSHTQGRRLDSLALAAVLIFGAAIYAAGVPGNPPGFHIDESSVAYNAHLIAETGRDEHGTSWPLFFRAFGEYKNPVYIYLLAAVFKLTGPSITAARLLSAALGVAAALALGLLARRATARREALPLVTLTALLTPWLFELSRVVFEVALFPLALALFLLVLHRAAARARWTLVDAVGVAALLALLTYTYSIGRLLGPLLALGLAVFITTRARLFGVLWTWALYALMLVPAYIFQRRHPGSMTGRFSIITYLDPQAPYGETAREFAGRYLLNLDPWRMAALGDPDINHLTHISGYGLVLALTGALAVAGAWRALSAKPRERWWLYVLYGLLVSPVPASLTKDHYHTLRLAPVAVFVVTLSALGLEWFLSAAARRGRARLVAALFILLALPQGALFLWKHHAEARTPRRLHLFDAEYARKIFEPALRSPSRPIYIADVFGVPGYIQAYWQATLRGVPVSEFARLSFDATPPRGALTITTEPFCLRCEVLSECSPYILYLAGEEPPPRSPLPAGGHRAELRVPDPPDILRAGAQASLVVRVRNAGDALWLARERAGSKYQVTLGNHWLDAAGRVVVNDDGRNMLNRDLAPGDETEMTLNVKAPRRAGDYLLEIDMLEEGVSWFGLRGSKTVRLPVKVE